MIPNFTVRSFRFIRTYLDTIQKPCPRHWYVHRPLTHLLSPDSASPAVRFGLKQIVLAAWTFYLCKHQSKVAHGGNPQDRTFALFCTEPYISSFQGASYLLLGFRFSVQGDYLMLKTLIM